MYQDPGQLQHICLTNRVRAETSAVRLAGLEGLGAMAKAFDRAAIETQILPVIQQVRIQRKKLAGSNCGTDEVGLVGG